MGLDPRADVTGRVVNWEVDFRLACHSPTASKVSGNGIAGSKLLCSTYVPVLPCLESMSVVWFPASSETFL